MSNFHFSCLDNVKMTCKSHKFPSKLLLERDMFTLTFEGLEIKPVFLFGNLRR